MPADIILYALVAAGLIFWLKNILGTEDDEESKNRDNNHGSLMTSLKKPKNSNNVVSLSALVGPEVILPRHVRIDNKTTENTLTDIAEEHEHFDLLSFAEGAEQAFQMVIEAFAEGDLDTLRNLLSDSVYSAFETAVKERNKRKETVETEIQSIEKMDIIEAAIKDDILYITVRFTAREICVIRDKKGDIISGEPDKVTQMVDVWVFGRGITSEAPEWYLYETRDDEIEDHKTPIPEGGKDKK